MLKRWTVSFAVLLLMGHSSIYTCQEAQELATETNDHDEELSNSDSKNDDSILSHIHFSDNPEEETEKENSDNNVTIQTYTPTLSQCCNDNVHLFRDIVLGRRSSSSECHRSQTKSCPVKQEYQRPICKEGEGCDIPLNCYDFVTNGPREIVPDPPRVVELTPLELQNLLGNGTYKNCCVLVMFYAPWCEYSVNFAQRYNAIGRTFFNLPVVAVDLSAHDP